MKKPDIPLNEPYRLQALRALNILDTEREERFDRLTRLARRIFEVPVALLSLADENRMWFKSCAGVDYREIPRDISFCGHVILSNDVFIIPDTTLDERFADNPGVVNEPGIRFYAGCPFSHPDGSKLGTLSIFDYQPRTLSADDIDNLRDLTTIVENELLAVHLATLDDLTQLTNRRGFLNLAEQSLKICERQGWPASLVFLDLDDFKQVNDRYGHDVGDKALRNFATVLKGAFRESDICARLSGDEFVVLLPKTSRQEAEAVCNRFTNLLAEDNSQTTRGFELHCSCGMVEFDPDRHLSLEELLKEGDCLMYQSKQVDPYLLQ